MYTIKKDSWHYRYMCLINPGFRDFKKTGYTGYLPRTFCQYWSRVFSWILIGILGILGCLGAIFNIIMFVDKPFHQQMIHFANIDGLHFGLLIGWFTLGMFTLAVIGIGLLANGLAWFFTHSGPFFSAIGRGFTWLVTKLKSLRSKSEKTEPGFWQTAHDMYKNKFCPTIQYEDLNNE